MACIALATYIHFPIRIDGYQYYTKYITWNYFEKFVFPIIVLIYIIHVCKFFHM